MSHMNHSRHIRIHTRIYRIDIFCVALAKQSKLCHTCFALELGSWVAFIRRHMENRVHMSEVDWTYMYICIFVYIFLKHTCIYIYIDIDIFACIYTYIYACVYATYICTYIYMYLHMYYQIVKRFMTNKVDKSEVDMVQVYIYI